MNDVTASPAPRSRRPVLVLFVVSLVALLAASVLTVIAVAGADSPERCCAGPVPAPEALLSPTSATPGTRAATPAQCVLGSWLTVEDVLTVRFYTDSGEVPMTTRGRYYEFHPDGTGVERNQNIEIVGDYRGERIRIVANGWREFTWSATETAITYKAITRASLTWSYYDSRGLISTQPEPVNPRHNEVNDFSCSGGRLVESNASGFRSEWARTGDYGYYG
jgi:hypothetical protein